MALNIKPLGDRLLVEPAEEKETKKGGIIIPDTAKEKPQEGKVVAAGPGKMGDDGKRIPMELKKGDRVLFAKYAGSEIKVDGVEHIFMREDDILGILE
jgi:chaperonin GroES